MSTHLHFGHDALHRLQASKLLDRLISSYTFSDLQIHAIAGKYAIGSDCAVYYVSRALYYFHGVHIMPPKNSWSWKHYLIVIEKGGLRILHWGDNRRDPSEEVWEWVGEVDIALLFVDNS